MANLLAEPTEFDRSKLEPHMRELLAYAKQVHDHFFKCIPTLWDWYYAKPATETRSIPFQDASNIVYPLIRTHLDQIQAQRHQSLIPTQRIWIHNTDNEDAGTFADDMGRQVAKFLSDEGSVRRVFDLNGVLYDATRESEILNESIFRLRWGPKDKWRFAPGPKPRLRKVRISHGPFLEHIPRQNVMWQPGCTVDESPWVIREVPLYRQEIETLTTNQGWDRGAVERLLKTEPDLPALTSHLEGAKGLGPVPASRMFAPYRIYETLIEFPSSKGVKPLEDPNDKVGGKLYPPLMIWLDREGNLLYVGTYPYPTFGWNYYQLTRSSTNGMSHDQGGAEMLEHFQRGVTTMLNQAIDAITLHNSIMGFTRDRNLIGKPFVPGQFTFAEDLEGIRMDLKPPHIIQPNVQVIQVLFAGAERLMGTSDPFFGRESRLGGHPSPATNLIAMLQQGSLKLKLNLDRDRQELSRLGNDLKAFYESYGAGVVDLGRLRRRYGTEDAALLARWLQPQSEKDLVEFDIAAIDDTMNPESEMQKQIMIDQLAASYIARVLEAMSNIPPAAQQFPELGQALAQAIQIFSESYKRVLEAANIDDPETFMIRIQGLTDASKQSVDRMGEAATGALAALSAANPGLNIPELSSAAPAAPNGEAYSL